MTQDQFFQLKNKIRNKLSKRLYIDQHNKNGSYKQTSLEQKTKYFDVYNDDSQLKVLTEMMSFIKQVNGSVTHEPIEEQRGRVGYYEKTQYSVSWMEVKQKLDEPTVEDSMRKAIRGIFGMSKYGYIDCKIMKLFKEGKISWEEAKAAHMTDCSL